MCTVSASLQQSTLIVTMNRDEQRSRREGALNTNPERCYPTDIESGGTWCGINQFGVAFCLLNRYDVAPLQNSRVGRSCV